MNTDIQLATGGLQIQQDDLWGQQQAPQAHAHSRQQNGLAKLYRMLRGRVLLATVLGVLLGVAGAVGGFMSQKPAYRSDGFIVISPIVNTMGNREEMRAGYKNYMKTQVALIQSERVMRKAMDGVKWRDLKLPADYGLKEFSAGLDVEWPNDSQHIKVSFTDGSTKVAMVGSEVVIKAYESIWSDTDGAGPQQKLTVLERLRGDLASQIKRIQDDINLTASAYGIENLDDVIQQNLAEQMRLKSQLNQTILALRAAEAALAHKAEAAPNGGNLPNGGNAAAANAIPSPNPVPEMSAEAMARVDPTMRSLLSERLNRQMQMDRLDRIYGSKSRQVGDAKADLDLLDARIKQYADAFRRAAPGIQVNPDGAPGMAVTPDQVEQLRSRVGEINKLLDEQKTLIGQLGIASTKIKGRRIELEALRGQLEDTKRKVDDLTLTLSMRGQMEIASYSTTPLEPSVDKRKMYAAVGFFGGGMLPFALFLMVGLFDARYRYSEDAGADLSGVTLLGILPNLPDLLTDPEQASIAAHCVHQIRTMLQINAAEDRQVFAVTSASPGDGKTSLTLALGLSFAAAGSRTLLIDADLVGAGLTHRLNVDSTTGVLDAMAGRSITDHVRTTDIANLAILPVGGATAAHAATLSPTAFRRVLAEARKQFDTILIDTGPVLGSIEATPVCASADAVILTVARGQQRPLVEKALNHLLIIGARLAGVVFNKAETRDFERSISAHSLRASIGIHPQDRALAKRNGSGDRYGPVARAVVSSSPGKSSNGHDLS